MSFNELCFADLTELKALKNPPVLVKDILECVSVLVGNQSHEWRDIKKMLANPKLLNEIGAIENDVLITRCEKIRGKSFNIENVMKVSKASVSFAKWVNFVQSL
ncbi:Oidioi.mRNA.OKI2018_I69.PAR.g9977.t1.cds [Oikopleura dioica]|uniref:Oidioi.mRNA.OKI2018_I69.PAR.g9977.t1.cds n=1 Tax=Oikopleura dioica TaxID=34765 RepID=A0ABN7RSL1_OIKDI|nr:Oidioi.mRNA.OKI2018_I69.PAR.g9977.t1.cds [Oikopleura dioica]